MLRNSLSYAPNHNEALQGEAESRTYMPNGPRSSRRVYTATTWHMVTYWPIDLTELGETAHLGQNKETEACC